MHACPDCGKEHALDTGALVRCDCPRAPFLGYCAHCARAVRAERAGDRRLCTSCGRELAACQRCRSLLVRSGDGTWSCPACRLEARPCRHPDCGELVPLEAGRARCAHCGRTSAACPSPGCHGLVPLLDGLHSLDCPDCRSALLVCSNRHCRQVFLPGDESVCPACSEPLLHCPTPGCEGVVAVLPAGHCDRCGEGYRLCRVDGCLTANARLGNFCRRCGAMLAGQDPVPAPPGATRFDFRHEVLGWVDLPDEFEARYASHVRGAIVGGRPFFSIPHGVIIAGGYDAVAGAPAVRMLRAFDEAEFAKKEDILVFGLSELVLEDGDRRRRYVLATSWRRVVAADVLAGPAVVELLDVRRYHGPSAALVGPPLVRGTTIVTACRRGDDAPGLALDRFEVRIAPSGRIEARRAGGRVLATDERNLIGPLEVWGDRALVLGGRTLFSFSLAEGADLDPTEIPVFGEGGALVAREGAPVSSLLTPELVFLPGNPRFAGNRVLFFGADRAGDREKAYSFYELGQENGGPPRLVQTVRGITENQVRFVPLVRRGAVHLLFLWRRGLHLFDLVGGVRDLEVDAAFDPAGGPVVHGDHVACRIEGSNAIAVLRVEEQGRTLRLTHAATLGLGETPAVSAPLFDGSRVYTLHVDPKRPRRRGGGRGERRATTPI